MDFMQTAMLLGALKHPGSSDLLYHWGEVDIFYILCGT